MSTNKTGAGGEHRFRSAFRKNGKRTCIPCLQREIADHNLDIR